MNFDGSNLVQLTGKQPFLEHCATGYKFVADRNPVFTYDGKKIIFARVCFPLDFLQDMYQSIYIIDIDGRNKTAILDEATSGILDTNPKLVAGKIVFSSNRANPSTQAFDMYSMNVNGTITRLTSNTIFDSFSTDWMAALPPAGSALERISKDDNFSRTFRSLK